MGYEAVYIWTFVPVCLLRSQTFFVTLFSSCLVGTRRKAGISPCATHDRKHILILGYMSFYYHGTTLITSGVAGMRVLEDLDGLDSRTWILVPFLLRPRAYILSRMFSFSEW